MQRVTLHSMKGHLSFYNMFLHCFCWLYVSWQMVMHEAHEDRKNISLKYRLSTCFVLVFL